MYVRNTSDTKIKYMYAKVCMFIYYILYSCTISFYFHHTCPSFNCSINMTIYMSKHIIRAFSMLLINIQAMLFTGIMLYCCFADTGAPRVHNNVEIHEKFFAHEYIQFGPKDLTTSIISIMNVLLNAHWPTDNNSERLVTSHCHQFPSSFPVNLFSFL